MLKPVSLFLLLGGLVGCLSGMAGARDLLGPGERVNPWPAQPMTLYIGTYTKTPEGGICLAHFNDETGELGPVQTVAVTPNPSFLAASPDGRFLYAVNEWGPVEGKSEGGLSAFQIEPATGQLSHLNAIAMGGSLCHLAVDATGKWLLATAYSAGTVSIWPLRPDGSIGARTALIQHSGHGPNQGRQSAPHAHHIVLSPDNRRAFVADLGIDKAMIADFDAKTGQLTPSAIPSVALASGAGPRHLALSLTGQFLYVVSELNNTITAFKDAMGAPQQIQVVSTLPAGFTGESFVAEIAVRPDGRFLYVSNRGHNSLACYAIGIDGQLKLVGFTATGRNPRNFTFDPSGKWLLVANQSDRSLSVFRVDTQSGTLTPTQQMENLPDEPVCLLLLKR